MGGTDIVSTFEKLAKALQGFRRDFAVDQCLRSEVPDYPVNMEPEDVKSIPAPGWVSFSETTVPGDGVGRRRLRIKVSCSLAADEESTNPHYS